ncbi:uncharacterized protein LOC117224867 [Megalopta genalis]|uniref:uncharacterized protein LOC117224867 n=1 Tax=Megalopta genalis TaxID=115081 RepID=UPI003FD13629
MINSLRTDKFMFHIYNLFMRRTSCRIYENMCSNHMKFQIRYFEEISDPNFGIEEPNKERKRTVRIPNIRLIHPDGTVTITLLERAQKIAKSRNFFLVKESYVDTDARDVYKLCDKIDVFGSKSNKDTTKNTNHKFRSTKYFQMQSKISEHDLIIKLDNINKLLQKNYKIKLVITFPTDKVDKETIIKIVRGRLQGDCIDEKKKGNALVLVYTPLLTKSGKVDENVVNGE